MISTTASLVIGLMSGTSLDGIDAALVEIGGATDAPQLVTLATLAYSYPDGLQERLLAVAEGTPVSISEVSALHRDVALAFAEAALALMASEGITAAQVSAIGSHGQTVHHQPPKQGQIGHTLQLGHGALIAGRTGVTTVSDLRSRDMVFGGQGAPLVPLVDHMLLGSPTLNRCIQNLGGIGNVTFLGAGAPADEVIAFDTGPANLLIDGAMQCALGCAFDREGETARRGRVDSFLLGRWLAEEPYFQLSPPKSTGREVFGYGRARRYRTEAVELRAEDLIATLSEFTVQSIVRAYRQFLPVLPDEIYLCGGGAHNRYLVERLGAELSVARVDTTTRLGVDADFKEAIAFAVLAWLRVQGVPANLPAVTGAERAVLLGDVHPPK